MAAKSSDSYVSISDWFQVSWIDSKNMRFSVKESYAKCK